MIGSSTFFASHTRRLVSFNTEQTQDELKRIVAKESGGNVMETPRAKVTQEVVSKLGVIG